MPLKRKTPPILYLAFIDIKQAPRAGPSIVINDRQYTMYSCTQTDQLLTQQLEEQTGYARTGANCQLHFKAKTTSKQF
jgi:hypothetical protein